MVVKVLVSTASKHGSTAEIGNRIAAALRAECPTTLSSMCALLLEWLM
jgi:menaquinone-dependent protoporphyrinogen IX oxidase